MRADSLKFSARSILVWLVLISGALGLSVCFGGTTLASPTTHDLAVPRYAHIFVIVEENKDYGQVMDPSKAPNIARLAKMYGLATRFYAEVHPSEPNYVALVSGDTYGIHDDDAYFCRPGSKDVLCEKVARPDYVNHTLTAPHIGTQLERAGLTWKGYYESIPSPGSLAVTAGDITFGHYARTWQLYASKHSGFINFASVQHSPRRAQE